MTLCEFENTKLRHYHNINYNDAGAYPARLNDILGKDICDKANNVISRWDGYAPTPLVNLSGLASTVGLAAIHYKHEGSRFGLGSFKALGGAYSVLRLLSREIEKKIGETPTDNDITTGCYADIVKEITVATATDGNHGRSVAWGAQKFGCKCFIYMHAEVSQGRAKAVEAYGASVVWVDGNYDESVRKAAVDAVANGWFIVSDTSYEGYTELPKNVMAGYTVMSAEIVKQLDGGKGPTHIFVQGGVGGLAGAICAHMWQIMGGARPRFVIVEPDRADCLYQSGVNGKPTDVHITEETIMAGLSCGEVSSLGWEILKEGTQDFMTITDDLIAPTMKLLAEGVKGDKPLVAGESAVAGLAGVIGAMKNPEISQALGLDHRSSLLLLGTEGATDPEIYQSIVGKSPAEVGEQ